MTIGGTTDSYPYNNVANYVTTLGTAVSPYTLHDISGNAPSAVFNGTYTVSLTISKGSLPGISGVMPPTGLAQSWTDAGANSALGSVLLITVTVGYGSGNSITLDGYRTQYAPDLIP